MTETGLIVTGRHLTVSDSTRRKNPSLFTGPPTCTSTDHPPGKPAQRIRQSSKPLMNKLETEFYLRLKALHPSWQFHLQAITFKLANGLRYTPDIVTFSQLAEGAHFVSAWEVKGKWVDGDSFPKLKMAAFVFPAIAWRLGWKQDGLWQEQLVQP